jgi:hypothetical protein
MKQIIGKFFASIRQKLFNQRVNREIFHRIFPHLNRRADHGYPFSSDDELVKLHIRNNLQVGLNLRLIGEMAGKMPKAYGDAFRYIVYRNLNEQLKMYLEIAERRIQPETCDPHFVATRAT